MRASLIIVGSLAISLSSPPAMAGWSWRIFKPSVQRESKAQLQQRREAVKTKVEAAVAASRTATRTSRYGKNVQSRRTKPFKAEGPDSTIRGGYTLRTNLKAKWILNKGWDTSKNALQIDTQSKPLRRYRRAAARLRGKRMGLGGVFKHLDGLITSPNKRFGHGPRLLGLERLTNTSERSRVPGTGEGGAQKLSDFIRHGQGSNLEHLVLMQLGLQAAGVKSKLVTGRLSYRMHGSSHAPMWIEIQQGTRSARTIVARYGMLSLLPAGEATPEPAPSASSKTLTMTR